MNKLSVKLGTLFFIIIIGIETFMFVFLHSTLVDSRVDEELTALQARGNSHRAILEKHFNPETIAHVALMESESNTDVVITDITAKVLGSSTVNTGNLSDHTDQSETIPRKGKVVEEDWRTEPFISTSSPIQIKGKTVGYVTMFQDTKSIQFLIKRLNKHFLIAGVIVVIITFIIIIFLSKALTRPLIEMKEATALISKGKFSVRLPKVGNDELGDLAKSIKSLADELDYLTQERSDFLASISHELRTPLTYIKGYTDIVLKRDLKSEEQENYLKIISEETIHLSELIKDLFDLAKIDKNSFVIQKKSIGLEKILNRIQIKLAPAFLEKDMDLVIICPQNLSIMADPVRLEQIILNLLDNSIKYSLEGGKTVLTAVKRKQDTVITIKDNGKGIPESDLPYIFNRFYRVEKARTRALGGSGLGLSIVKELVHAHGGVIAVQSKENEGTEVEVVFKGDDNQ